MKEKLFEDLQTERRIVMEGCVGRKWENALRKYDELAIRYDQIKKVFEELQIASFANKADEA